jgi:hypothetical protein
MEALCNAGEKLAFEIRTIAAESPDNMSLGRRQIGIQLVVF